ncbi:MAG: ATP-binding protein [bacterium]|nr:ATP-binding protein [bacterium]
MQESERAAQAASRAKSTFLANISHEIRTPMASILGYADLLLANLADAENRSCAATIKRNGQYLLELINDILDLSRIEAGKFDVDFENCDLPRLIGDVQSLMQVRAVEKNIQLEVAFEGKVPRTIQTDPKRLRQVLINLVGNAIKFTEEGQVRIRVKLLRQPAAACLEIAVEDTGIGIDEAQRAQLFEPFSQGELTISRRYGGSGLGLAISQRLMELLHGSIEYSSQIGKGTTFLLHLPIGSADTLHLVEPDLLMEPSQDEPSDRQPTKLDCRLLIVDDRRDVRYVSQHFLQKAGATVTTAEDGLQAVSLVLDSISKGCPFDLILMDMQMPEMDGLQATAKLRSAGVKTPIIALTAGAMRGDRERYLSSGCDDYIAKPIEAHQLIAKVAFYTQTLSLEEVQQMRSLRQAKSQHKPAPDAQAAEDDTSRELD